MHCDPRTLFPVLQRCTPLTGAFSFLALSAPGAASFAKCAKGAVVDCVSIVRAKRTQ